MMSQAPAWLTAGAAVVQALATIVIYKVTREYVQVTKRMADAASEQLRLGRLDRLQEDKQVGMTVTSRARALQARVEALPASLQGPDVDRKIRTAALWNQAEVEALHTAAASMLSMAGDAAARASTAMAWLLERCNEIRAASMGSGADYSRISPVEWASTHSEALMALRELAAYGTMLRDMMDDFAKRVQ